MKERKGEKTGWLVGWTGGFVWLLLLAGAWFIQGQITKGILMISLFAIEVILIVVFSPWKHPETKYWKLMLPIYIVLIVSVSLYVSLAGGLKMLGLNFRSLFILLPCFIPFATVGGRSWKNNAESSGE